MNGECGQTKRTIGDSMYVKLEVAYRFLEDGKVRDEEGGEVGVLLEDRGEASQHRRRDRREY